MKRLLHITLFAFMLVACKKDIDPGTEIIAVKLIANADNYNARSIFTDGHNNTYVSFVGNEDANSQALFGSHPAQLSKLNAQNELLWQIELPNTVYTLWKSFMLSDGNILCVGTDDALASETIGLAKISPSGKILLTGSKSIKMDPGNLQASKIKLNCIELENGSIAILTNQEVSILGLAATILLFDENLNYLFERVYSNYSSISTPIFSLNDEGNISALLGIGYIDSLAIYGSDVVTINPSTLDLISSYSTFMNSIRASNKLESVGRSYWVFGDGYYTIFQLRNQEEYRITRSVSFCSSDKENQNLINLSGYPGDGYISKLIKCEDGGFLMVGTCNIYPDQSPKFKVLAIKLTSSLSVEWMEYFDTGKPTIAQDVVETFEGFKIFATHNDINELNRPVIITLNKNGNPI